MLGKLLGRLESNTIPINGKPYLTRYYLTGRNEKFIGEKAHLYLHHFHMSDQPQELHNHPHTGTSLILRGGYIEERMTEVGRALLDYSERDDRCHFVLNDSVPLFSTLSAKVVRPGDINRLGLEDFHRAQMLDEVRGAWTLFWTGPRVKEWGFLDRDTLGFYPYEGQHSSRIGRGPHARAQVDAVKALADEVTQVFKCPEESPGRIAQAQRLGKRRNHERNAREDSGAARDHRHRGQAPPQLRRQGGHA